MKKTNSIDIDWKKSAKLKQFFIDVRDFSKVEAIYKVLTYIKNPVKLKKDRGEKNWLDILVDISDYSLVLCLI